jgi:hypothetical protein
MSNFYIGESEVFPRMLPTKFDSLGKGVSEKKIFSEISQSEPRMICGGHVCYRSPQAILVSAWLISKKSSLLKLFDQINQILVGSILERSSIKIANVVQIR